MLLTGYDLRGIFKKELNFDVIYKATDEFFKKLKIKKALLGVDYNKNNFLIKNFLEKNFNLEFIGILPTPIFYYQVIKRKIPGIMITASHLPLKYSGLKFILENGEPWKPHINVSALSSDDVPKVHSCRSANAHISTVMTLGQARNNKIINEYFGTLFAIIKPKKKIFVNFDNKNFFLNASLPYFKKLKIYYQKNSPIKINSDLDNDRIFVYIKNRKIHNDLIFYYLALLPQYKNLGVPIFFSQKLKQELIKKGKKLYFIQTGHYYFKKAFKKYNLDLAFEPSGHFYMFKELKTEAPYLASGLFLHSITERTDMTRNNTDSTEKTRKLWNERKTNSDNSVPSVSVSDLSESSAPSVSVSALSVYNEILKLNNSLDLYRFDISIHEPIRTKNEHIRKNLPKKFREANRIYKIIAFLKKKYKLKLKKFDGFLLFNKNFYLHLRKSKTENKLRVSFEGNKKFFKEIKKWLMKI